MSQSIPVKGFQIIHDLESVFASISQLDQRELFQLCGSLYSFPLDRSVFLDDVHSLVSPEGMYGLNRKADAFLQIRKVQSHSAMIAMIFVKPTLRNAGLGRSLIENSLDFLRSREIHTVRLNVFADNPARHLYLSMGFEISGRKEKEGPEGNPIQKWFMEKSLR